MPMIFLSSTKFFEARDKGDGGATAVRAVHQRRVAITSLHSWRGRRSLNFWGYTVIGQASFQSSNTKYFTCSPACPCYNAAVTLNIKRLRVCQNCVAPISCTFLPSCRRKPQESLYNKRKRESLLFCGDLNLFSNSYSGSS